MSSAGIKHAVLMCHAPIVIPEIAADRSNEIRNTTDAMKVVAHHLIQKSPSLIIILSPHTPRLELSFSFISGKRVKGNFGQFGYSEVGVDFENDIRSIALIREEAKAHGLTIDELPQQYADRLDHGAMVPLYFLTAEGWTGRIAVLGFPYYPSHEECRKLGNVISKAASRERNSNWCIIASGDMSHRITKDAPAGFHPRAKEFDEFFSKAVALGKLDEAVTPNEELRKLAAEDVVDSVEIAAAATDFEAKNCKVIQYEAPFGVGYLQAILHNND